jgi:hypothetical protein
MSAHLAGTDASTAPSCANGWRRAEHACPSTIRPIPCTWCRGKITRGQCAGQRFGLLQKSCAERGRHASRAGTAVGNECRGLVGNPWGGLADGGSGAWPGGDPPRHQVHGMGRIVLGHACSARLHPFAQDGAVEASVPARCALMGHAPRGGPRAQRRHAHAEQARRRGYGDEIGVSRDWMRHSGDFLPGSARPQRTTGMGLGYPWGGVSPPQA